MNEPRADSTATPMVDLKFDREDASQVILGSFSLAVPVAFTEEAWQLGETLPAFNLLLIVLLSLFVLALFAYYGIFLGNIRNNVGKFFGRLLLAYGSALLVVMVVLIAIDKFPLFEDPMVAIKRMLIVGMPSSMGALVVDSFDKESWGNHGE